MKTTAFVLTLLAAIACCVGILCLVMFGLGVLATETFPSATLQLPSLPSETPVPLQGDSPSSGLETLETLTQARIPENDPAELAVRLGRVDRPIPKTIDALVPLRSPGMVNTFWAGNSDTNENFQIEATLAYITEHSYFWVQNGIRYDRDDLQSLAEDFENHMYPTVRAFFGSEWSPGIDGDPRIYILYAEGLGSSIAGYFSSADEVHPLAQPYSNGHEMFFLNADTLDLDESFTYGVLAHEFQHMVHWNGDRNEETWINEGFAEVAALLTGYYDGGFDYAYARDPDIPLLFWPDEGPRVPHYGGAFLYLAYFLDRFGSEATQQLVASPENGLTAIDKLFAEIGASDPARGAVPDSMDLFQDFSAAMYLRDGTAEDGRFDLSVYPEAPSFDETETFSVCPSEKRSRDVNQFGIDIFRITCEGSHELQFVGSTSVPVLPESAFSGDYAYWSNRGDEADLTLTRAFDFTEHEGSLTFEFQVWYNIEEDYDYAYLLASTDQETWTILRTPRSTNLNPTGANYGWAYNGKSFGWVRESVDISDYAGQQVWLRFEYITDAAVNGDGLLLDDVAIPETGYFTDFEMDDPSWQAEGFVRIDNVLPQTYRLTLITQGPNGTEVIYLEPDAENKLTIQLEIGAGVDEAALIVSGTTRYTREKTGYQVEILP